MQIDVGAYISELLYEHSSVTIPGLGGFTSQYKPTNIDQIQGTIKPPSKEIIFNKNLKVNDGLLIKYISEKHLLNNQEAQKAVEDFVQQINQAFDRKEMVLIPRVGRLYKDYKGEFEFLPENTNFNQDSYGLPIMSFKPVIRSKEEIQQHIPAAAVKNPNAKNKDEEISEKVAGWFQNNFPLVISVSVIVVAIIIFLLIYNSSKTPDTSLSEIPEHQVNKSPSKEREATSFEEDSINQMEANRSQDDEEANSTVEQPSQLPGQKSCVIVIGLFGDQDNVTKLVKKIYDAGFEPYLEERGKYTRVGIQFAYDTDSQITETLRIVQEKFEEDAVVIKR